MLSSTILVIKDTVDLKNLSLFKSNFSELFGDTLVVYTFNIELTKELLINDLGLSKNIDFKNLPKVNITSKIRVGFLRYWYFLSTSRSSTSSLQKLLILFKVPKIISFNARISKNHFWRRKKKSLPPLGIDLIPKNNIIYMRSDSIQNYVINCLHPNHYSINVIRNVDAPFMKGLPIVKSECFINLFPELLKEEFFHKDFGYEIKFKFTNAIFNESPNDNRLVVYAMTHPGFFKDEFRFVLHISKQFHKDLNFKVKLHPSVDKNICNLMRKQNIQFYDCFDTSIDNFKLPSINAEIPFLVIAGTSTVLLDFQKVGCKNLFYINDPLWFNYSGLYRREHLEIIINKLEIKMIENIKTFIQDLNDAFS